MPVKHDPPQHRSPAPAAWHSLLVVHAAQTWLVQMGVGLLHGWQICPGSPQVSPCCSGSTTQVAGVFGPASWQVKQVSHGGSQAHEPQSTVFLQLFLTLPHFPAHVLAVELALHVFL